MNENSKINKGLTVKDRVELILANYPETRNSDTELIRKYWVLFNGFGIDPDIMKKLQNPITIWRNRQLIQAEGKYPAIDRILAGRRAKEKQVRQDIKKGIFE